jgi:hypothetical protein
MTPAKRAETLKLLDEVEAILNSNSKEKAASTGEPCEPARRRYRGNHLRSHAEEVSNQ